MDLTYSEILTAAVPLSVAESVSLVLAAANALEAVGDGDRLQGFPDTDHILLSVAGGVRLAAHGGLATDAERVAQLTALLRSFVMPETLADEAVSPARNPVPGPLLLALARASGHMEVPPPTYDELVGMLIRFGSPDPVTLASIHRRVIPDIHGGELEDEEVKLPVEVLLRDLPIDPSSWEAEEESPRRRSGAAIIAALIIGLAAGFAGGYTVAGRDALATLAPENAQPSPVGTSARAPQPTSSPGQVPQETAARGQMSAPVPQPSAPPLRSAVTDPIRTAAPARLFIESRPDTAEILIDGRLVGTTPLLLPNISAGTHRVRLELEGHQPWVASIDARAGTTTRVAGSLQQ
jgi:hypothetical protein